MSEISFEVTGLDEMIAHVARIGLVHPTTIQALEDGLHVLFMQTQEAVHVVTGSLKASGHPESHYGGGEWEGAIVYGGPSPGFPNDPVDYAGYELARGGSHDFLAPAIEAATEVFGAAMESQWGI